MDVGSSLRQQRSHRTIYYVMHAAFFIVGPDEWEWQMDVFVI